MLNVNDVWFDTANGNRMSVYNGSSWSTAQLGYQAISSIDAGTITVGKLSASYIDVTNLYAQALNPSGNNYVTCGSVSIARPPSDTIYTGYGILFKNSGLSNPVMSATYDTTSSPILFNCLNGFKFGAIDPTANHAGSMSMCLTITPSGGFNYQGYGGGSAFSCDTSGNFNVQYLTATLYKSNLSGASYYLAGATGTRWNIIPAVDQNGVMEVGQYIDFHESNGDTSDNSSRLFSSSGTIATMGNFSCRGQLNLPATTYPQLFGNGSLLQLAYTNNTASGVILEAGTFRPAGDASDSLGKSNHRWTTIYATSSTILTSDRNEKNSIADLDTEKTISFISALKPVSYKLNDGNSGRTHYGLIAQDVEATMDTLNMTSLDFAGLIKSPKNDDSDLSKQNGYLYGLRYEEFIAPLIKAVQYLLKKR